ncbi:MAG: metal ABC transporter permease [Thermoplasmata archaeon]|jgi:zinc/manganese transport system permease protein|nr:metal ABC transporter permease [Thermoplasmata archaeon]
MTDITWVWWGWNIVYDLRVMLQYEFVRNAFEAGTVIAILAGVVSYLVVLRRSSFAAHALGHVGFSGAAGAVLFGVAPIYGLLLFTTTSGSGIALLGQKASHRDVEIGTVLAFMLGLGLLFLSFYNGFATEAYSILFGSIVGISNSQVVFTVETSLAVLAVLAVVYRQLLFASLDEEVAEAKGMHTLVLGVIFMLALAVAISIAVTIIGVLLIFALTVTPAAIAIRLSRRPLVAVLISVLVALFATWAGIFIAFYEVEPTSFFIVTIVFVLYVIVRILPFLPRTKSRRAVEGHGQGA